MSLPRLRRLRRTRHISPSDTAELVASVPFWWHAIDLGKGIVTPGMNSLESLRSQWETFRIPELRGKTVLDVGAWDGFFSFEAERRGAKSVVALDHYVWSLDLAGQQAYWRRCSEQGIAPRPYHETEYWQPDELPGKRGFDVAKAILRSNVRAIVGDFMTGDPDRFGKFDVVLYIGVLYHMEDPFGALKRLARVTKEIAIIHTEAITVRDLEEVELMRFFPAAELNNDISNWWAPNLRALSGMCSAAGFREVVAVDAPDVIQDPHDAIARYRVTIHARI